MTDFFFLFNKKVTLRDLRTFKMEHEFDAFSGSLSDFDVHGNLLAACGFSSRGLNGMACDRFLMVYDLRMMRAVTPLQVHVDPLFLRFIPTYTSRLAIISQTGTCQRRSAFFCNFSTYLLFLFLFLDHLFLCVRCRKNYTSHPCNVVMVFSTFHLRLICWSWTYALAVMQQCIFF